MKSASASIPRIDAIPDNLLDLDNDLAKRAAQRLGYRTMAAELSNTKETRELYQLLIDLGIRPLDEAAVIRYKQQVRVMTWAKPILLQLVIAVALGIVVALLPLSNAGMLLMMTAMACAIGGSILLWHRTQPSNWRWQYSNLVGYHRPVPAHVLATALLIDEALGDNSAAVEAMAYSPWGLIDFERVRFLVEEFRFDHRVADPFLIVQRNGARVYVDVWDEPTFKV